MSAPGLRRFTKWLPHSWRLALLKALAWPEYEVSLLSHVYDEGERSPRVERLPLNEAEPSFVQRTRSQRYPNGSF